MYLTLARFPHTAGDEPCDVIFLGCSHRCHLAVFYLVLKKEMCFKTHLFLFRICFSLLKLAQESFFSGKVYTTLSVDFDDFNHNFIAF